MWFPKAEGLASGASRRETRRDDKRDRQGASWPSIPTPALPPPNHRPRRAPVRLHRERHVQAACALLRREDAISPPTLLHASPWPEIGQCHVLCARRAPSLTAGRALLGTAITQPNSVREVYTAGVDILCHGNLRLFAPKPLNGRLHAPLLLGSLATCSSKHTRRRRIFHAARSPSWMTP